MTISLIVAVAENGVIGREGGLPWRLSADLRRFKQRTMGHHLVMGRKTFESLGRVLPGRTSLVFSRQTDYSPPPGVLLVRDVEQAIECARGDDELFVIGGAQIYQLFWPRVDRVYLTRVRAQVDGDVRMDLSDLESSRWRRTFLESHGVDEKNEYPHDDEVWERVS